MEYKNFIIEEYPQEIAQKLYKNTLDMDYMDHEEEKEEIIAELEEALYHLKAICENEKNQNYFRTFYKILERI